MKNKNLFKWLIAIFVITMAVNIQDTYAQVVVKRLPDGSEVLSDGSIRLPNGTVRYPKRNRTTSPGGTTTYPNGGTRQSDGSIIYPDGTVRYPDGTVRYPDGTVRNPRNRNNNGQWLPPGQAKKIYGGSAKDYAPGHNKGAKGNGKHGR